MSVFKKADSILLKVLIGGMPLVFLPYSADPFRSFKETFFHIAMLGLVLSFLCARLCGMEGAANSRLRESQSREGRMLFVLFLLASLAFALPLLWSSPAPLQVSTTMNFLLGGALFFSLFKTIDEEKVSSWINILLGAAIINAVFGTFQYLGMDPFFVSLDPDFHSKHPKYVVAGFMDSPNMLAPFLCAVVPFLLAGWINSKTMKASAVTFSILAILLIPVLLSRNIAGIISLGAGSFIVVLFFTIHPSRKRPEVFRKAIACWVAGLIGIAGAWHTWANTPADLKIMKRWSIEERKTQNRAAMKMFSESPVFGKGAGSFYRDFVGYRRAVWFDHPRNVPPARAAHQTHNDYVQLLGEGGLVAALPVFGIILLLGFLFFRYSFWALKRPELCYKDLAVLGSAGGFAVLAVNALGNFPFHVAPLAVTAIFFGSLLFRLTVDKQKTAEDVG